MVMRVLNSSVGLIWVCRVVRCVVRVWWCSWLCLCSRFWVVWFWCRCSVWNFKMLMIISVGMKIYSVLLMMVVMWKMLYLGLLWVIV